MRRGLNGFVVTLTWGSLALAQGGPPPRPAGAAPPPASMPAPLAPAAPGPTVAPAGPQPAPSPPAPMGTPVVPPPAQGGTPPPSAPYPPPYQQQQPYPQQQYGGPAYGAPQYAPAPPPPPYDLNDQPRRLPFDGSATPPAGYTYHERANRGFLISGSIVLGVFYMIGISDIFRDASGTSGWMYLPVAGPFIERGSTDNCDDLDSSYDSSTGSFRTVSDACRDASDGFLTFLGVSQGVGAGLLALSFLAPAKYYLRNDLAQIQLTPWASQTGGGLGARGAF